MIRVRAMREVQAHNVDAGGNQLVEDRFAG
jgi:hypothetical protein